MGEFKCRGFSYWYPLEINITTITQNILRMEYPSDIVIQLNKLLCTEKLIFLLGTQFI